MKKYESKKDLYVRAFLIGIAFIVFLNGFFWLFAGINNPILDDNSFRQPQTALTVYWLLKGGAIIPYETPVLGYPWTIPFEFPFYQLFVAAVTQTGLGIDTSGRIVSYIFFILTLIPAYFIFKTYRFKIDAFIYFSILYLASPLYVYWSRTFLIDTTALFFCSLWLSLFTTIIKRPSFLLSSITTIIGIVSILCKTTTFPAFAFIGLAALVVEIYAAPSKERTRKAIQILPAAAVATAVPLISGVLWLHYTDTVKLRGIGGSLVTSSNLSLWNYGTWESRFGSTLWRDVIGDRIPHETFGSLAGLAILLILVGLTIRRNSITIIVCIAAALIPILIFTHLHVALRYYQVANAVFLIACCALAIQGLGDKYHWTISILGVVLIAASQILYFQSHFSSEIRKDTVNYDSYLLGDVIRKAVPEDAAIVVIGDEWSSAIPYYAQRRAVMIDASFPRIMLDTLINRPSDLLGPTPLGAIIDCGHEGYDASLDLIERLVASREQVASVNACRVLAGNESRL